MPRTLWKPCLSSCVNSFFFAVDKFESFVRMRKKGSYMLYFSERVPPILSYRVVMLIFWWLGPVVVSSVTVMAFSSGRYSRQNPSPQYPTQKCQIYYVSLLASFQ